MNAQSLIRHIIPAVLAISVILVYIKSQTASAAEKTKKLQQLTDSENFWKQSESDIFEAIYDKLINKSHYGDHMLLLNKEERIFLTMSILMIEVNNGGFDQFFFNTRGHFNKSIIPSAIKIGASDIADICQKALSIQKMKIDENDKMSRLDIECDSPFYKSKDDIEHLCVEYAKKHKSSFKY